MQRIAEYVQADIQSFESCGLLQFDQISWHGNYEKSSKQLDVSYFHFGSILGMDLFSMVIP